MINKQFSTVNVAQLNLLNNPDSFDKRLETLHSELQNRDIDFLCLQEVLVDKREQLEETLTGLGFVSSVYGETVLNKHGHSGNAIFSKHSHTWYEFVGFSSLGVDNTIPAVVARTKIFGTEVYVVTAHLAWGGNAEQVRLRQATLLSDYSERIYQQHPGSVIVLTGDFNAMEDNSTIRYLTGKQENHLEKSTYWVDAYKMHGSLDDWVTSDPCTFWGSSTARHVGILHPELIPSRRIDYIFSYGWCYGKPGSPLSFERFGTVLTGDEYELSDHYGLISRILVK